MLIISLQSLENKKRIFTALSHRNPDDPRFGVDVRCAAEVARDEAARDAIVPGFRVYREGFDIITDLELKRCFGV